MTFNINGKEYQLKYSFRALMIYENITHKSFNPKTITDMIVFFYSIILAANKGCELMFEEFMDWIDDNPESVNDFSTWLTHMFTQQQEISPVENKKELTEEESKN